uniref:Uncharacterized protein n=1 Tax=Oryza punctata TaxID=4537 RepID=A0A0E0JYA8_ORYPU
MKEESLKRDGKEDVLTRMRRKQQDERRRPARSLAGWMGIGAGGGGGGCGGSSRTSDGAASARSPYGWGIGDRRRPWDDLRIASLNPTGVPTVAQLAVIGRSQSSVTTMSHGPGRVVPFLGHVGLRWQPKHDMARRGLCRKLCVRPPLEIGKNLPKARYLLRPFYREMMINGNNYKVVNVDNWMRTHPGRTLEDYDRVRMARLEGMARFWRNHRRTDWQEAIARRRYSLSLVSPPSPLRVVFGSTSAPSYGFFALHQRHIITTSSATQSTSLESGGFS